MVNNLLLKILNCPKCKGDLEEGEGIILCNNCKNPFLLKNNKIFFIKTLNKIPEFLNLEPEPANQKKWSSWRKANYSYFKEHLTRLSPERVVLDLGAGPSQFRDLTKRFENFFSVDFSPYELIDVVADLTQKLPFKDSSFDAILLSNVLEHIPNVKFFLKESWRVLKKEGFIIGTTPFLMRVHQRPYDFYRFTNYMLEKLLKEAEFKKIEIQSLASSFDVYRTSQRHFFEYLLRTNFSKNKILNSILKFVARAIWQLQKLLRFFFSPLYQKCRSDTVYTQGYGFLGFK